MIPALPFGFIIVLPLSGNATAFQESFRKLSTLQLKVGAVDHLLEYLQKVFEKQKAFEESFRKSPVFEWAVPPIEVTSVKNILCGGREEGVCF